MQKLRHSKGSRSPGAQGVGAEDIGLSQEPSHTGSPHDMAPWENSPVMGLEVTQI